MGSEGRRKAATLFTATRVICVTVLIVTIVLAVAVGHIVDRHAETARVHYCMNLAPYAAPLELTDCLKAARG